MKPDWLDIQEYPFEPQYFNIDGQRLHYIDEGHGPTILFVHGTPSWSFDYRHLIKALRPSYRCVAIDHIGFGLSDKPEQYDYTTQHHSRTLEQFMLQLDLKDITLVVHDFGGPIGFDVAIKHPDRISGFVIFNTWMWSSAADPDFIKFSRVLRSPLLPFLYRYLNFSPRFILPQSFGDKKLSRKLLKQYTRPFSKPSERNGALAFVRSLLHDQDWFESLRQQRDIISQKPALILWGMKDKVIGPQHLEKFKSVFSSAHIIPLLTCGHFPQEEEHEVVVREVQNWLKQ
jgi:haloalkane dehalogenase